MTTHAPQLMMRYPIDLPTDYDMGIVRRRVSSNGRLLDDRAGLSCKAYCIREAGVHGSQHNQYAPFYVWHDAQAASEFLWRGGGFDGIVRDFGRPTVGTWLPAAFAAGDTAASAVTAARIRTQPIPRTADLIEVATHLDSHVDKVIAGGDVHLACAGIDPQRWETIEFSTHVRVEDAAAPDAQTLTVLHVGEPA
ncbi:DUF4865 family protein [Solicola gregarius]|uniref:DUF4865 family protein n=1 Tax=Solicola gregarius TaxID=2908642 RepID=A0AA46TF53_9ACTN|nr:DUF4865 family protein [Solicola gregarius]UYM03951.1 DUF4865 family protein [Solicola gregarius]